MPTSVSLDPGTIALRVFHLFFISLISFSSLSSSLRLEGTRGLSRSCQPKQLCQESAPQLDIVAYHDNLRMAADWLEKDSPARRLPYSGPTQLFRPSYSKRAPPRPVVSGGKAVSSPAIASGGGQRMRPRSTAAAAAVRSAVVVELTPVPPSGIDTRSTRSTAAAAAVHPVQEQRRPGSSPTRGPGQETGPGDRARRPGQDGGLASEWSPVRTRPARRRSARMPPRSYGGPSDLSLLIESAGLDPVVGQANRSTTPAGL
jgi:hypothetical protein